VLRVHKLSERKIQSWSDWRFKCSSIYTTVSSVDEWFWQYLKHKWDVSVLTVYFNVISLTSSRYAISEIKDYIIDTDIISVVKELKTFKNVYIVLLDDEDSDMTLNTEINDNNF